MYDHKVFAVLTPCDPKNKASSAFKLQQNSNWFQGAVGGVAEEPTLDSREANPAEDLSSDDEDDATDRLVLTFDKLLKEPLNGIQFGTSQSSHVVLGYRGTKGISAKQYNITVDDDLRIWLHDYHLTHGTAVGYSSQNQKEVRKKEKWILAYKPGLQNRFGTITIHSGGLIIQIEFPNHAAGAPQYVENLRKFVSKCQETESSIPAIGALGLESEATTQAPSKCPTPSERLIYYDDGRIGGGSFGEVHRVVRAMVGKLFVAKRFKPPSTKRKLGGDNPAWLETVRREFRVMKDHPHVSWIISFACAARTLTAEQPNVMQVFEFRETPEPIIIMDYYPLMSINSNPMDDAGYVSAFGQTLDGLVHLHANNVAHRNLKPKNLLVQREPCFKVVITNFGLAKVATSTAILTTFCGSLKYAAPKVFPGVNDGYEPKVNLWSLGVIFLK